MDENEVRTAARAVGDALVAGNVDEVLGHLSEELGRNPGEVVALLPLPATEVTISAVDSAAGTASVVVVLAIVGETSDVELQTRWKDRDGQPRIVEVSHLSSREREVAPAAGGADGAGNGALEGEPA